MNNLFATGIWNADAKYSYRGYINMLPRVLNALHNVIKNHDSSAKIIVHLDAEGEQRVRDNIVWKRNNESWSSRLDVQFTYINFEELPPVPEITGPCALKLGWKLSPEKLNRLNRIWCNKTWLMQNAYNQHGPGNCKNVIWIDGGLKLFHKNFPREFYTKLNNIQPGVIYSNRYGGDTIGGPRKKCPSLPVHRGVIPDGIKLVPTRAQRNPYNIRHRNCGYPHFIRAGVLAVSSQYLAEFHDLFIQTLEQVSSECGSFDEETVLSAMFINNPEKFSRWGRL